jgi:signal transduction histidine kinase
MHHTLQGTRITVALSQSETHVDLSVTDNGPGIPEAERVNRPGFVGDL